MTVRNRPAGELGKLAASVVLGTCVASAGFVVYYLLTDQGFLAWASFVVPLVFTLTLAHALLAALPLLWIVSRRSPLTLPRVLAISLAVALAPTGIVLFIEGRLVDRSLMPNVLRVACLSIASALAFWTAWVRVRSRAA